MIVVLQKDKARALVAINQIKEEYVKVQLQMEFKLFAHLTFHHTTMIEVNVMMVGSLQILVAAVLMVPVPMNIY